MYQTRKFPKAVTRACRPVAACAALVTAIVLLAVPSGAEPLRMDHENETLEAIEIREFGNGAKPSANERQLPRLAFDTDFDDRQPNHEPVDQGPEIAAEPVVTPPSEPAAAPLRAEPANGAQTPPPIAADPMIEASEEHLGSSSGTSQEAVVSPNEADPFAADEGSDVSSATGPGADQKPIDVAAVQSDKETDIFDQWAHQKFTGRKEKKPHPLAAMHPDHFVVVCEGGCADEKAQIVYMERRDARGPVNEKPLKSGVVVGTSSIDCVGGCYDGRRAYNAVAATWDPSTDVAKGSTDENGWMTTVKKPVTEAPQDKKGDSAADGRWYDRIN